MLETDRLFGLFAPAENSLVLHMNRLSDAVSFLFLGSLFIDLS
jgi:hypothetical protein